MNNVATKEKTKKNITIRILQELQLLRRQVSLILPQESLKDYSHPQRIKRSYQKALKKHPPVSVWK